MIVAAVAVIATLSIGYRTGRAHASWRDYRSARYDVPAKRRQAWSQTRRPLISTVILLGILFIAGWNASR
jgi:hypothetical protein